MDSERARQRCEQGGAILCLDVPEGTEMRCDLTSWMAGHAFKGIKMIPPGLHIITWAAGHEIVGSLFVFRPGHVETWRWDAGEEDMDRISDPDEAQRLAMGVRNFDFDSFLGPYPDEQADSWTRLTYLITAGVLERSKVSSGQKLSGAATKQHEEGKEEEERADSHPSSAPYFAPIPSRRKPPSDMDPSRLSKYNMDGSERAEEMAKRHFEGNWMEMLGQLQLSFVLFLAISSLQGLDHWKNLVALLCSCGDLARSNPSVMSEFVRLLRREIEQLPEDFFKDELLCDSFLGSSLRSLCQEAEWVDEADANLQSGSLLFKRRIQRLKKVLSQRFGFEVPKSDIGVMDLLDASGDDDAPTVVTLADQSGDQSKHQVQEKAESSPEAAPSRMSWMLPPPS